MGWLQYVTVMTIFCYAFVENSDVGDQTSQESARETRELDREGWRVVETLPNGNFGWIPHDQFQEQLEEVPKRRRLRKRKRRPPVFSLTDDLSSPQLLTDRPIPLKRKIRPQRLDQIREPWEDMTDEAIRKPNIRRRVTPAYQPSDEIIIRDDETNINPVGATIRFENERDEPTLNLGEESIQIFYGQNRNEGEELATHTTTVPDLKTVLKQTGGSLSLSEILQQKNLSLTELLMGNQKAISALTEKPHGVTESSTDFLTNLEAENVKKKRLPPSSKNINRKYEQEMDSLEALSTSETLETQRKRLASLQAHKDSKLHSSVTTFDIITEPTTERRIFVPSHPKYYTSVNYKPNLNLDSEHATEPLPQKETTTIYNPTTSVKIQTTNKINLKPKLKPLPITNAKINKLTTKATFTTEGKETDNYPVPFDFPKPIKINIKDVFGYKNRENKDVPKEQTEKKDEPLRISIDLENITEQIIQNADPDLENDVHHIATSVTPSKEPITTAEPLVEKVPHVTAKDEIMEILKDPISRERLARILENRNMTFQELVEQRERGSSQVHLADIFHNKTREPEPKGDPLVGRIHTNYFTNLSAIGRKQKSYTFSEEQPTTHMSPTEAVTAAKESSTSMPKESYSVTSFPTFKIEVTKNKTDNTDSFLWKELYPDFFQKVHENNYQQTDEDLNDPFDILSDPQSDIHRLEQIDNTLSSTSNEKFNIDDHSFEDAVLINIPSGVKSAIIVSLAIIGLSIMVFLTILLLFKWAQKQKRKSNYCNSLSPKLKAPIIMQGRPANAIKSFMIETLGRKKNNYYRTNIQSLPDEMWEDCRDRKPSF